MDETNQSQPGYSNERTETAVAGATINTVESSGAVAESFVLTHRTGMAILLQIAGKFPSSAEVTKLLKRKKREVLIVAGAVCALVAMVVLMNEVSAWVSNARERRLEQAVASATPDRLIARCGQPAEDTTKEVYPIVMRTMSYQSRDDEKLVVAFSRTAEEQSDWVFLSMKGETDTKNYDTPDAKAAALPCLNSKK